MEIELSVVQEPQLDILYYPRVERKSASEKQKERLNVLSLFSGCGGMDLGFHKAGFNIKWANDIEQRACETYAKNIGNHIICGDITQLDYSKIPDADLILGGFPCQDFSIGSKDRAGLNGEKSSLFYEYLRLLKELKPKYFLLENVEMTSENKKALSDYLGVEPVFIDSIDFSVFFHIIGHPWSNNI